MNDIICISDLHLADKGPRDNFHARGEGRLNRILDWIKDNNYSLYILGDLYETWQANFGLIVNAYADLISDLKRMGAIHIVGNHDNIFTPFMENGELHKWLPSWFLDQLYGHCIRVGGKRIMLAHGHEFDSTCASLNPGIGNITAVMSALLEDKHGSPTKDGKEIEDKFIESLEFPLNIWRSVTFQKSRLEEMQANAEQYRQEQRADYLIYGHTHSQGKVGNCFNCGCWCRDSDGFVKIDGNTGEPSLWTWDGHKPVEFER
jgi:UDP-2,3-diacylglucosamine pyrophosphatase LpxH